MRKIYYLAPLIIVILMNSCKPKKVTEFYDNNMIKRVYYTVEEQKTGREMIYYEDGQLKEIINWKNGVLDGEVKAYYNNGKLASRVSYKNNTKVDTAFYYIKESSQYICKVYKENSDTVLVIYFAEKSINKGNVLGDGEDTKLVGLWETRNYQNNLIQTREYKIIKGSSIINEIKYYNNEGIDTLKSRFMTYDIDRSISKNKDTLKVDVSLKFYLHNINQDDSGFSMISYGDYAEDFSNLNTQISNSNNYPINSQIVISKRYLNKASFNKPDTIRGIFFGNKRGNKTEKIYFNIRIK